MSGENSHNRIVYAADEEGLDVGARIMRDFVKVEPQPYTEYMLYVNDKTKAVRWCTAYDTFIGRSCRCSIANISFTHLPRAYLRAIFEHAFITRRCEIILITTYGSNVRSLEFTGRLGFVEAFRLPEGAPDGSDYIVSTMKKSECRHIRRES